MLDKRGISVIVSYVLLIVIAVGISISVYSYLRLQVPKERNECPAEISLIVQDYTCNINNKTLDLTLINKGLFKVDRVSIRIGLSEAQIKEQIQISILGLEGLNPGEKISRRYEISESIKLEEDMAVEVVPILFKDGQLVLCEKSIINQPILCI